MEITVFYAVKFDFDPKDNWPDYSSLFLFSAILWPISNRRTIVLDHVYFFIGWTVLFIGYMFAFTDACMLLSENWGKFKSNHDGS